MCVSLLLIACHALCPIFKCSVVKCVGRINVLAILQCVRPSAVTCMHSRAVAYVLDTALLQWISEYAVRAYTTADSAVLYLNHAQIA